MRRVATWVVLAIALACLDGCGGSHETTPPSAETTTAPETAPPSTTPSSAAPLPAQSTPFSWSEAGAFVWHETDLSPEEVGRQLRMNGFGWVALLLHDGLTVDPVEGDWIARFRKASGLPVGGWGVLRTAPAEEAALADDLLARYGLDFYIADAEAEYGYSGPDGQDPERFRRSREFVEAFRALRPSFPAGLSSYCRPDEHDLDWAAWNAGGFVFLPQAYVNDFGPALAPTRCVEGARAFFPAGAIHPTIGMYAGRRGSLHGSRYARLLEQAGTVGFSVFLAETGMTPDEWRMLGEAIRTAGIAHAP